MTRVSPPPPVTEREDFLFPEDLASFDPEIHQLVRLEEERQARKLILIASESICPAPVREASASVFGNIYAEGYPGWRMTDPRNVRPTDYEQHLSHYRRYADGRYYKGCDYVNFVEALAQKRCAELFATPSVPADRIFANVQSLSGAAANNAVYTAFVKPGGVVLGMKLSQGGHLTHGSPSNRSGIFYRVVPYGVDEATGRIDYDQVRALAAEHRPQMIIAGASAYPWTIDWALLRRICDESPSRPILLADVAHPAGLIAAGAFPSPIGFADVVSFTTHKTLCGPRGAVILTTDAEKAARINAAVFPGEQGGPHIDRIAGKAVGFKLAATERFRDLMHRVVENARAMAEAFRRHGRRLVYGGTDTHLLLLDLKSYPSPTGMELTGEIASRVLDLVGITCNKNAVRDDRNAAHPTALRFGTTWVTQRGFGPEDMDELAGIVDRVLSSVHPFFYTYGQGSVGRGKIDFDFWHEIREEVALLETRGRRELEEVSHHGYPFYEVHDRRPEGSPGVLALSGKRCHRLLESAATSDLRDLAPGRGRTTFLLGRGGVPVDRVEVLRLRDREAGHRRYLILSSPGRHETVRAWLRSLSDGYTLFDAEDVFKKVEGPAVVEDLGGFDLRDPRRRRARLTASGPGAVEALARVAPATRELTEGEWFEVESDRTPFLVYRPAGRDEPAFEILVVPEAARELGADLSAAGARVGARATELPATAADLYRSDPGRFDLAKPYFVGQDEVLEAAGPAPEYRAWTWTPPASAPVRKTPANEWHKARTRQGGMVPFAGWEMPVRYASILEEHQAVRRGAGLFDVAHMGVLEVAGPNAESFLDALTSNYVAWLEDGEGQYSYLLDPDGTCLDDILVYRRAWDRFMVVVNAANADQDLAWLRAAASGEVSIDRRHPGKRPPLPVEIRDLKDPGSGEDQRVDVALQGPASFETLRRLTDADSAERIHRLKRFEFVDAPIAEIPVMVSRTGYTGEPVGYELYVHPDRMLELWQKILSIGEPLGVRPAGLGARDSTRMEAGFPLHGHELAGSHGVSPLEAGYEPFVMFHKPFFAGRRAMLANFFDRTMTIVRFELVDEDARLVRAGDPIASPRSRVIGHVTSCTAAGGLPYGLAYVDRRFAEPGSEIFVFRLPPRPTPERPKTQLAPGDPVILHARGRVLPRFARF